MRTSSPSTLLTLFFVFTLTACSGGGSNSSNGPELSTRLVEATPTLVNDYSQSQELIQSDASAQSASRALLAELLLADQYMREAWEFRNTDDGSNMPNFRNLHSASEVTACSEGGEKTATTDTNARIYRISYANCTEQGTTSNGDVSFEFWDVSDNDNGFEVLIEFDHYTRSIDSDADRYHNGYIYAVTDGDTANFQTYLENRYPVVGDYQTSQLSFMLDTAQGTFFDHVGGDVTLYQAGNPETFNIEKDAWDNLDELTYEYSSPINSANSEQNSISDSSIDIRWYFSEYGFFVSYKKELTHENNFYADFLLSGFYYEQEKNINFLDGETPDYVDLSSYYQILIYNPVGNIGPHQTIDIIWSYLPAIDAPRLTLFQMFVDLVSSPPDLQQELSIYQDYGRIGFYGEYGVYWLNFDGVSLTGQEIDSEIELVITGDWDGDGVLDYYDDDDDNDGHPDDEDDLPFDSSDWEDLDGDGTGDKTDTDLDGDGAENGVDPYPRDARCSTEYEVYDDQCIYYLLTGNEPVTQDNGIFFYILDTARGVIHRWSIRDEVMIAPIPLPEGKSWATIEFLGEQSSDGPLMMAATDGELRIIEDPSESDSSELFKASPDESKVYETELLNLDDEFFVAQRLMNTGNDWNVTVFDNINYYTVSCEFELTDAQSPYHSRWENHQENILAAFKVSENITRFLRIDFSSCLNRTIHSVDINDTAENLLPFHFYTYEFHAKNGLKIDFETMSEVGYVSGNYDSVIYADEYSLYTATYLAESNESYIAELYSDESIDLDWTVDHQVISLFIREIYFTTNPDGGIDIRKLPDPYYE